jgi:hypothetical protein
MSEAISGNDGAASRSSRIALRSPGRRREKEKKEKKERRRNAERRVVTSRGHRGRTLPFAAASGAAPPIDGAARLSAFHRGSRRSVVTFRLSSRPGFLGRGGSARPMTANRGEDRVPLHRALPAPACPSPEAAPLTPAVVPERVMPRAARARRARPRAGTALAPTARLAVLAASFASEDLRIMYPKARPKSSDKCNPIDDIIVNAGNHAPGSSGDGSSYLLCVPEATSNA